MCGSCATPSATCCRSSNRSTVNVQTEALGLSAEEVEQLITVPLEQDLLDGVAWLDTIRSQSVAGLSNVELVFEPGTDLYRARQVVQERISQAAGLPNVSQPPQMLQPTASTSRVEMIALSSKELTRSRSASSPAGPSARGCWPCRASPTSPSGVSASGSSRCWSTRSGWRAKAVTLEQVISSTGNALWVSPLDLPRGHTPGTGGFIDTANQRLGVQHNLPISTPDELAKVAIDESTARHRHARSRLGDVATVVRGPPAAHRRRGRGRGDGAATGLHGRGREAPVRQHAGRDERASRRPSTSSRPASPACEVDPTVFRPATYVDASVDNLGRTFVVGAGPGARRAARPAPVAWRPALVALSRPPRCRWRSPGSSLHLAGRDVQRHGARRPGGGPRRRDRRCGEQHRAIVGAFARPAVAEERSRPRATEPATVRVRAVAHRVVERGAPRPARTAVWATVILGCRARPAVLPRRRCPATFFPPMAVALVVALVASLLVAVDVHAGARLRAPLRGGRGRRESPALRWLRRGYDRVLGTVRALRRPARSRSLVVAGVLGAFVVIDRLDHRALLPALRDTNLLVHWEGPFGHVAARDGPHHGAGEPRSCGSVPGVTQRRRPRRPGGARRPGRRRELRRDVGQPSIRRPTTSRRSRAVRRVVDGYPGLRHDVVTYTEERLARCTAGRRTPVDGAASTARTSGCSAQQGRRGPADPRRDRRGARRRASTPRPRSPRSRSRSTWPRPQQHGIKPGDVRRAAAMLLSGLQVGSLFEQQKVFDVVVWSTPENRHSLTSVREPADRHARRRPGPARRRGRRAGPRRRCRSSSTRTSRAYLDVTAAVSGRSAGAVAGDVRAQLGTGSPSRSSTTPRCSATTRNSRARSDAAARLRHRGRHRHLPAAAGGLRQLAAGDHDVPDAAGGARPAAWSPPGSTAARSPSGSSPGFFAVLAHRGPRSPWR